MTKTDIFIIQIQLDHPRETRYGSPRRLSSKTLTRPINCTNGSSQKGEEKSSFFLLTQKRRPRPGRSFKWRRLLKYYPCTMMLDFIKELLFQRPRSTVERETKSSFVKSESSRVVWTRPYQRKISRLSPPRVHSRTIYSRGWWTRRPTRWRIVWDLQFMGFVLSTKKRMLTLWAWFGWPQIRQELIPTSNDNELLKWDFGTVC